MINKLRRQRTIFYSIAAIIAIAEFCINSIPSLKWLRLTKDVWTQVVNIDATECLLYWPYIWFRIKAEKLKPQKISPIELEQRIVVILLFMYGPKVANEYMLENNLAFMFIVICAGLLYLNYTRHEIYKYNCKQNEEAIQADELQSLYISSSMIVIVGLIMYYLYKYAIYIKL